MYKVTVESKAGDTTEKLFEDIILGGRYALLKAQSDDVESVKIEREEKE